MPRSPEPAGAARLQPINRSQSYWGAISIEDLIPPDHLARAIWELTGQLDLRGFLQGNKSVEGRRGRDRIDPRLLTSVWVYGYSQGIGSAREIERQMEHEPGLRWLCGDQRVNHHSLSDFRVDHGAAVEKLLGDLLGLLSEQQLIDLNEVTQDGTKIGAAASASSFRREKTLEEHLSRAEEVVRELSRGQEAPGRRTRQEAAQARAAEERRQRLRQAAEQLEAIRQRRGRGEAAEARVSLSEPEARVMKDGKGAYAPSYNVQVTTETRQGLVVAVALTQQANDGQQLEAAVERIEQQAGHKPERVLVDGGYVNAHNLEAMAAQGVEVLGPELKAEQNAARNRRQALEQAGIAEQFGAEAFTILDQGAALQCPAGQRLRRVANARRYTAYQADRAACAVCAHRPQCCPRSGARRVKLRKAQPAVAAYAERMRQESARALYRKRGPVAEFPHAWIKEKLGLRKFHVRGLVKAGIEALWAALTYDIQQWARLCWRRRAVAVAA